MRSSKRMTAEPGPKKLSTTDYTDFTDAFNRCHSATLPDKSGVPSSQSAAGRTSTFFAVIISIFVMTNEICRAADPLINSWFTPDSGELARIYRSDAARLKGESVTTWDNGRLAQSQPACGGVQQILSSTGSVYVLSTGLGTHIMGPWYLDPQHRYSFPNLPTDQHFILRLPRHPVTQTSRGMDHLGEIGMFVDGVRMFDANDSFSYSNENGCDAEPRARIGQGDGVWNRDAYVNEGVTFDAALGHQQNWGRYHYHAEPLALRYRLGDHVDFDDTTKTYRESKAVPVKHSPILGWMHDGFPLYGPFGFSNATNPAGGVRRMVSGYVIRDGSSGADNLAKIGRRALPAWAARELNRPARLESFDFGPEVSGTYPLGHYLEDYAFLGDLGKTVGRDYDLDETNGRWCVTPDFPQGTFAYFTTIDAAGRPAYPYNMGRHYHGAPTGRLVRAITETVTTNFVAQASPRTRTPADSGTVKLRWQGGANGSYQTGPK